MKYILTISLIIFLSSCWGQYPKLKVSDGKIRNSDIPKDTTLIISDLEIYTKEVNAIPVIMLISDTSIINGKINNKAVWLKGYRVNADYQTFYLDANKRELPKNIIIWLDQNR